MEIMPQNRLERMPIFQHHPGYFPENSDPANDTPMLPNPCHIITDRWSAMFPKSGFLLPIARKTAFPVRFIDVPRDRFDVSCWDIKEMKDHVDWTCSINCS